MTNQALTIINSSLEILYQQKDIEKKDISTIKRILDDLIYDKTILPLTLEKLNKVYKNKQNNQKVE